MTELTIKQAACLDAVRRAGFDDDEWFPSDGHRRV